MVKNLRSPLALALLLITSFSFASASGPIVTINITNGTISASGFLLYEGYGKYPAPIITDFIEALPLNISCSNITTGNITSQVCSFIGSYTKDVPITLTNQSLVVTDSTSQTAYQSCLTLKSQFEAGLNTCSNTLNTQFMYEKNFTQCSTDLQICNAEKARLTTDLAAAKKELEDSKNTKWLFGIGGAIAGVIVLLFYRREIGGPKVQGPSDKYNKGQSG